MTILRFFENRAPDKFMTGRPNGTKQGGVLSPYLFTRYIRPLLFALVQSRIGCNIGGLFSIILLMQMIWCC